MNLTKTWPETLGYGETKLGIPYSETEDGGVGPNFFDCSGLTQNVMWWAGDPNFTRTTYSQWADQRYTHMGPYAYGEAPPAQAGWIAYMHVSGEADPGHVGMCLGNGTYLNAPHTGENVQIEDIPNTPSEHVYGYLVPIYGVPTPPPPPQPTGETMIAGTPSGNGYWLCSPQGAIITRGDAQYLGGPNTSQVNGQWTGPPNLPAGHTIVSFAARGNSQGYWAEDDTGLIYAYGAAGWYGNTQ